MKVDRFVTSTWTGHFDIPQGTMELYNQWAEFEKELDPSGAAQSTTQQGWQYVFNQTDKEPDWLLQLKPFINDIRSEVGCLRAKTIWTVDYNPGGYQDPHFHNIGVASILTIVINLEGTGELILQDPRPVATAQGTSFADIVRLTPGDWIAIPAYVVHNSRPALERRRVLVLDVFVASI